MNPVRDRGIVGYYGTDIGPVLCSTSQVRAQTTTRYFLCVVALSICLLEKQNKAFT